MEWGFSREQILKTNGSIYCRKSDPIHIIDKKSEVDRFLGHNQSIYIYNYCLIIGPLSVNYGPMIDWGFFSLLASDKGSCKFNRRVIK